MQSVLSDVHYHSEEAAYAYVEARLWPDGPVCPHCGNVDPSRIGKLAGKTTRIGLYKCYACREPFNVKIGTVFEKSHVPMRVWLQAMYLMAASKKGISTRQLQRTFNCGLKTAWFIGHRVREAMTELNLLDSGPLGGANQVVEADETYVGGRARNRKNVIPPKAPVLSLVERDGRVRSFHVREVTAQTLKPIIVSHINKASYLMTDDAPVYTAIGRDFGGHGTVNHSAEEYVRAAFWHTNTVENFFSIFKRGIFGCYFHVSEAHLHRYAAEFDFRHNNRVALGIDDVARADRALVGAKGKRLTYATTGLERRVAPPF
ncbi:MAG: IS1595 family transposase [Stellaceae bacterium]